MFRRTLPVDGAAVTIVVEDTPVRVPAGESVAAAVLGAIEANGIRLQIEILPGVIRGTVMGGAGDGLPVITKAGAFGEPDTLLQLYGLLAKGR